MSAPTSATTSEVYVTVTDRGRRIGSIRRRWLAAAVEPFLLAAAVLAVSLALGGSGAGERAGRVRPSAGAGARASAAARMSGSVRARAVRHPRRQPKLDADGDTDGLLPKGHFDQDDV
jgi:hypothetical protein